MNRFCTFPLSRLICCGTEVGNCNAHLAGESRFRDLERDETAWVPVRRTASATLQLEILMDAPEQLWALLQIKHPRWDVAILENPVTLELHPVDSKIRHGVRFELAYPILIGSSVSAASFRIAPDQDGIFGRKFVRPAADRTDADLPMDNAALPEQLARSLAAGCGRQYGSEIGCGRFPFQSRFGFGLFWKKLDPDRSGAIGRSEWILAGRTPRERRNEMDCALLTAANWLADCTATLNRFGAEGWFQAETIALENNDPTGERGELLYQAELHFALIRRAFSPLS